MGDILLQLVWVAAHHGLRRRIPQPVVRGFQLIDWEAEAQWDNVRAVTSALGSPPAPGGPS